MLYSRVGRRSSPGIPAVAVTIESVRVPGSVTSEQAPPMAPADVTSPVMTAPAMDGGGEMRDDAHSSGDRVSTGRTRPPAPEAFHSDASEGESIARTLDRLIASDSLSHASLTHGFSKEESLTGPRELFGTLAVAHVRPVRELMIELRWGETSRESFAAAAAAVQSLRNAAGSLSLVELADALHVFGEAIAGEPEPTTRVRVLQAHEELMRILPAAFGYEDERARRETLIVQSVLLQLPDVHKTTLERIVAAGVGTIQGLADARPLELAEVAGIPLPVAAQVVEAMRAWRDKRQSDGAATEHVAEQDRLRALCAELADQNTAFEQASNAWSSEAASLKKKLRHAREQTLLAIRALLARLGEIPLLDRLEKLPFEGKLVRLHSFLDDSGHAPAAR